MAGTTGRNPSKNKQETSTQKLQRIQQKKNVPNNLSAAFDHPGIAGAIRKFVFETMQKGIAGLRREFAALRSTPDQNAKVPIDSTTASKFRYKDVFCTDKSRVILTFLPSFGDFIHANWLKSEFMENSFICCQGPLTDTCGDFWRMIYQEKVYHIFMLCRCEEMGKAKCHQYWPKNPGETLTFYGLITVKNEGVTEKDSDICTTNLTLTCSSFCSFISYCSLKCCYGCFSDNGRLRKIEHRQWNTWPDKSVPRNPVPAFKLIHLARTSRYPVCVHCSAGIGRTGTLVALELLQRNFMHSVEPSVPQIVLEIRSQRAQAVQTEDQLVWLYYALLCHFYSYGFLKPKDFEIFHAEYKDYIKKMGGEKPIKPSFQRMIKVPSSVGTDSKEDKRQKLQMRSKNSSSKSGLKEEKFHEKKHKQQSSSNLKSSGEGTTKSKEKQQKQRLKVQFEKSDEKLLHSSEFKSSGSGKKAEQKSSKKLLKSNDKIQKSGIIDSGKKKRIEKGIVQIAQEKQQQKSSDKIQKSSEPKSSDKGNAKIAVATIINANSGKLKNPESPHQMKTESPRKKSNSKRQEEKLRKSSDQTKEKSSLKKSIQIKSASKSNSKASKKIQKSSEPTKSSDKRIAKISASRDLKDLKNPKSPHQKKRSKSPRIESTSKSESKRRVSSCNLKMMKNSCNNFLQEDKLQRSPLQKKKSENSYGKLVPIKSTSKSDSKQLKEKKKEESSKIVAVAKKKKSPENENQDSEADLIPLKKKERNLTINVNEILRIGNIFERLGMDEQRKKAFEWLSENQNEDLKDSPKIAYNLMIAIGDLCLSQELFESILQILFHFNVITQKRYLKHFAPLEQSVIRITVSQFAQLLSLYGNEYLQSTPS